MKRNRPVNLSLPTVLAVNTKSPVPVVSIFHRASGVLVFLLIPVLLYLLQQSLTSPESFAVLKANVLGSFAGGLLVFVALAALIFHFIAGVRHLIQDFGFMEELRSGRLSAWAALALAVVFIFLAFLWMVL